MQTASRSLSAAWILLISGLTSLITQTKQKVRITLIEETNLLISFEVWRGMHGNRFISPEASKTASPLSGVIARYIIHSGSCSGWQARWSCCEAGRTTTQWYAQQQKVRVGGLWSESYQLVICPSIYLISTAAANSAKGQFFNKNLPELEDVSFPWTEI